MVMISIICVALLFFVEAGSWIYALVFFGIANYFFSASNVLYDKILVQITSPDLFSKISGYGYAWGYFGGGLLFLINALMSLNPELFGLSTQAEAIRWSFITVSVWWTIFLLPISITFKDRTISSSKKILSDGDIINVDVTAIVDEHYGDTSRMFSIGNTSVKLNNLIDTTHESMMRAIKILKPGIKLGDIGHEIQSFVEKEGFSVVKDFCGHGISTTFHEPPNILHYGTKNTGMELKSGMTFTIEPMINAGKFSVKMLNDGWTAVTKDKSLSAQFEHTIGVTKDGCEIFTQIN